MENGRFYETREPGKFYNLSATEIYLEEESVDLFITHPPYYMSDIDVNGGNPDDQMQNAETHEEYLERMLLAVKHMEHALKPHGHIFLALSNAHVGLGTLKLVADNTSLILQDIRMWDYSVDWETDGNHNVVFVHFTKQEWIHEEDDPIGPYLLTNSWHEAGPETADYEEFPTAGTAPKAIYYQFIRNYSKPGDVVGDLFGGSGTVCLVASELSRKFVYGDVSRQRVLMAKKRLDDTYAAYMAQLNDVEYTLVKYQENEEIIEKFIKPTMS